MRKDRLTTANVNRKKIQDLDVTSALNRFMDEKKQSKSKPQSSNQFAENLGVSTDDEVGSLLKAAINKLRTDPNDFHAKMALEGMGFLYKYENLKIINGELDKDPTYYNFSKYNNNDLDNQTQEENPIYDDGEPEPELQPDQYRESTFEQGKETTSKIGKIGDKDWTKDQKYDRTDPTQRRDRRLEDKLVEGRPLDKFKLNVERGKTGTPVSELFHKDKRRR